MTPHAHQLGDEGPALTSREAARWCYGWASGWPSSWSYPSRPKPAPKPEGKGHLAASNHYWHRNPDGTKRLTTKWDERHRKSRAAREGLRKASFYVRRHWSHAGGVWTSGPCAGMAVVDPLDLFNALDTCCHDVAIRPTSGGVHGNVAIYVRRCKRYKLCAICAHEESRQRATRALVVAARCGRPGALLSLVLTHRDRPPCEKERCSSAWGRHESAWQRLRTGENGEWWRSQVYGYQANLETTSGETGYTWHPHTHLVLELREGVEPRAFRDELAKRWRRCTALAALEHGYGLDVYTDRLAELRAEARASRGSLRAAREQAISEIERVIGWSRAAGFDKAGRERWCELLEGETEEELRDAVEEATKYATPHVEGLTPARLAEWIQWAIGRRLVRWGGAWEREDVQAWISAQVEYDSRERYREDVARGDRPDLGELIRGAQSPVGLDQVARAEADDKAKGLEGLARVDFEQLGVSRTVEDIQDARTWWRIFGEQRAALRAARSALEGPDDPRAAELAELKLLFASCRKLRVAELRAFWTRIQAEFMRDPLADGSPRYFGR